MSTFDEIKRDAETARELHRLANGNGNGRIKVDPTFAFRIVAWIVAWIVGALLTYGAVNARVSVVESQMQQVHDDMKEMKTDLKTLLRR